MSKATKKYFENVPIYWIGTAKIIRDTLIAATTASAMAVVFSNEIVYAKIMLVIVLLREAIGGFIKYSEGEDETKTLN